MPELDISAITSRANQLSNEELKQLLNDESYQQLDQMIKDLPLIKSMEMERDLLIEANKTSAELNLSREPTYREKRQQLISGHNQLLELNEEISAKKRRLSEVSRQTCLDTRVALMQTATAEAEEQSEDIANTFLASQLALESFVKEFVDKRKTSHLRRIKTEKMIESIRKQTSNGLSTSTPFAPIRPAPPPPPSLPFASNPQMGSHLPPYPIYGSQPMPTQPQQAMSYPFSHGFR